MAPRINTRIAEAAARLGLDRLGTAVMSLAAAPEIDPRCGRLFAYLNEDADKRLATPRLLGALLSGEGVSAGDVLACLSPTSPLLTRGALRFVEASGPAGARPGGGRRPARGLPARGAAPRTCAAPLRPRRRRA